MGEVWEGWFTVCVVFVAFGCLLWDVVAPDHVMMGALAVLMVSNVVSVAEGLSGFANEGLLTVAVLFVVAAGISATGGLDWYMGKLLGRPRTIAGAQLRRVLLFTLVAVRPRSRCERRSLRTFSPGASLRPPLAFNPRPRCLSTPPLTPLNSTPTIIASWTITLRLMVPIAVVSAFLNNTPVVAVMIPIVQVRRLVLIRPRSRCERRSLRTFAVVTLHPRFPFNV